MIYSHAKPEEVNIVFPIQTELLLSNQSSPPKATVYSLYRPLSFIRLLCVILFLLVWSLKGFFVLKKNRKQSCTICFRKVEITVAQWVERSTERPGAILTRVRVPVRQGTYGKGFFSQSQLSVQTLFRHPFSPCMQSHASTCVRKLTVPNIGIHCLDTRKYCTH